jgi:hypothetical protein
MRCVISLAAMSMLLLGVAAPAADVVPKRTEFSRYQAMLDHSPFAVATAAALPAATPNFAKDLYIANAARSPDGDLVTLASAADKNFKEYLSTKEPNTHGYAVANIEWSEKIGATKVTVSKDGQFATVTFNQALISTTGSGGMGGPVMPSVMPQVQQQQPPPGMVYPTVATPIPGQVTKPPVPALPTPPPRVRGVIPRNPSVAAPAPTPAVVPPASTEDE